MKISNLINKVIYGHQLNSWDYDESMPIKELRKNGFPYAIACVQINSFSIIALDVKDEAPIDFIEKNKFKKFILDSSKHPRNLHTRLGNKNVFYLKEYVEEFKKNDYQWAQFTINGFKEYDSISGAPENGNFSLGMIDMAFAEIEKKLNEMKTINHEYDFTEKEIGSFTLQVDFLNNDENDPDKFYNTSFKTSGFTYDDVIRVVQNIYNNIFSNQK